MTRSIWSILQIGVTIFNPLKAELFLLYKFFEEPEQLLQFRAPQYPVLLKCLPVGLIAVTDKSPLPC